MIPLTIGTVSLASSWIRVCGELQLAPWATESIVSPATDPRSWVGEAAAVMSSVLVGYLFVHQVTRPESIDLRASHFAPRPTDGKLRVLALRDRKMRRQAVRLLSGTRVERLARSGYNACRAMLPAALLSADETRARVHDRQTVKIASRVLVAGGNSVDAGASCGDILKQLLNLSPEGQHWAFEPIPNPAQQLRRGFPRARVEQIALSDFSGTAQFHFLPEAAAYRSLLTRTDVEAGQSVRLLPVQVRQLDDVIPEDLAVALIKIDVEGAEARVLCGAARLLERHPPVVVFECAPAKLTDCIPTLEGADLRFSFMADYIAGQRRPLSEVVRLCRDDHEFSYVASAE